MATQPLADQFGPRPRMDGHVELPAPTVWPLVLAFGFTLVFAGLLTSASVSILGAVLSVAGSVGWFRDVFPKEHEEVLRIVPEDISIVTSRHLVERLPVAGEQVRAWLPIETYPISAGVKGGLYPINLLAASVYAQSLKLSPGQLNSFHMDSFLVALVLHGLVSTLVGLLYGAMLPMVPRHPILLGGMIGPVLWTGMIYSILSLLNPLLESRIDWVWFTASQIAFGVVAGLVVVRQSRVRTRENMPFSVRAGIEAPGLMPPRDGGEKRL